MLFTFPSRYCSSIGHQVVFRLGGWSPRLPTGFLVSGGTLDTRCSVSISDTWLSHCVAGLPRPFSYQNLHVMRVLTPRMLPLLVWPLPRSLATTSGISVDFSSSPPRDFINENILPLIDEQGKLFRPEAPAVPMPESILTNPLWSGKAYRVMFLCVNLY